MLVGSQERSNPFEPDGMYPSITRSPFPRADELSSVLIWRTFLWGLAEEEEEEEEGGVVVAMMEEGVPSGRDTIFFGGTCFPSSLFSQKVRASLSSCGKAGWTRARESSCRHWSRYFWVSLELRRTLGRRRMYSFLASMFPGWRRGR